MTTASRTRSFTLVEGEFDPDGDTTDLQWFGFHIHDERGVAVSYADTPEYGLQLFKVAGVTHTGDVLQQSEFDPGTPIALIADPKNPYDRNAVGVWDKARRIRVGYVPRELNEWVATAITLPSTGALALAEHRKDGKRVSLTILCGPLSIK